MRRVVLYTRGGCHLCDVARATVLSVRALHRFAFDEIDIDADDALVRDYGYRVPVLEIDGEEIFEIDVPADAFAAMMRA